MEAQGKLSRSLEQEACWNRGEAQPSGGETWPCWEHPAFVSLLELDHGEAHSREMVFSGIQKMGPKFSCHSRKLKHRHP